MIDMKQIHDGSPIPFITVHQLLRDNGNRHLNKAVAYLTSNNLEYAIGSLRKAIRNYEAAQALSDFHDAGLEDYLNRLSQMIVNDIMMGN